MIELPIKGPRISFLSFEEYKKNYLDGFSDEKALENAEDELKNHYNNRIPGNPKIHVEMEENVGNYEKLEEYIIKLSIIIIKKNQKHLLLDNYRIKDISIFRECFFSGLQDLNKYETLTVLQKTVSGLRDFDTNLIYDFANLYDPRSYPFYLLLYFQLKACNKFDAVLNRVTHPNFGTCIHLPIVRLKLWPHQDKALECFKCEKNGIISMATATGKTLVGLAAICSLYKLNKKTSTLNVLILAPSRPLLNQWREETIDKLGLVKVLHDDYKEPIIENNLKIQFETIHTAHQQPEKYSDLDLIIFDEVHKTGGTQYKSALNIPALNKLGLSATIDGNNEIFVDQIGKIIFTYTLTEALNDGIIPEFELILYPTSINIENEKEFQEITSNCLQLFSKINKHNLSINRAGLKIQIPHFNTISEFITYYRENRKNSTFPSEWEELSINIDERRRILINSPLDSKVLTEIVNFKKTDSKCAVFCDTIESCQQLYNNIAPKDGVFIVHSKIESDLVDSYLEKFRTNNNGVLISPRIFDEGISIDDISEGFNIAPMLSPLQLVQRMGRILRMHDGKIPKFHHCIGIPNNFLDSDDSIFLHNHLSWFFDLALRTGISLQVFHPQDEKLITDINKSEDFLFNVLKDGVVPLKSGESVPLDAIIKNLDINIIKALYSSLSEENDLLSDERWLELIRLASKNDTIAAPHLRWILIAGNRNPKQICELFEKYVQDIKTISTIQYVIDPTLLDSLESQRNSLERISTHKDIIIQKIEDVVAEDFINYNNQINSKLNDLTKIIHQDVERQNQENKDLFISFFEQIFKELEKRT